MSRFFLGFIIISGLLLAFNMPAYGFIGPMLLLLIIAAGLSNIIKKKLPPNFLPAFAGLIIGPVLVCYLARALFCHFRNIFGANSSSLISVLVLLLLMTISFLYVRSRIKHSKSNQTKQLHTNERRPVLPVQNEHEREV